MMLQEALKPRALNLCDIDNLPTINEEHFKQWAEPMLNRDYYADSSEYEAYLKWQYRKSFGLPVATKTGCEIDIQ